MSDALPTISADQLTKAVSLAAAGTLSALEAEAENEAVDEPQNSDTVLKIDKRNPSLKLLEMLSSSVTSGLARLNHLNLDNPSLSSSPHNPKTNVKNKKKNETVPACVVKKYCSRKNYKLMPPLIPSQIRANLKRPGPKMIQQRQLVTLSHRSSVHSSQELKAMAVRPARYTTNYLFVRTQIVPPAPERGSAEVTTCPTASSPAAGAAASALCSVAAAASCTANTSTVSESTVTTTSAAVQPSSGTPILVSLPAVEPLQNLPSASSALGSIRQAPRLVQPPNIQPLFRLPFPVSNIQSKLLAKVVQAGKEAGSARPSQVKENAGQQLPRLTAGNEEPSVSSSSTLPATSKLTNGAITHVIVTVPASSCEPEVMSSHMTTKLSSSSTPTVYLRPSQSYAQNVASPQAVQVTCGPGNSASPQAVQVTCGPGNSTSPQAVQVTCGPGNSTSPQAVQVTCGPGNSASPQTVQVTCGPGNSASPQTVQVTCGPGNSASPQAVQVTYGPGNSASPQAVQVTCGPGTSASPQTVQVTCPGHSTSPQAIQITSGPGHSSSPQAVQMTSSGYGNSASPQTIQMTCGPGHSTSSGVSNIIASPGQILIASPSFRFVTGNGSVPTLGASGLKPPIVLAHVTNTAEKQNKIAQVSASKVVDDHFSGSKVISYSVSQTSKAHLPVHLTPGNNSVVSGAAGKPGVVASAIITTSGSTLANGAALVPKFTAHVLNLSKPGLDVIYTSPNLSKPGLDVIYTSPNLSKPGLDVIYTSPNLSKPGLDVIYTSPNLLKPGLDVIYTSPNLSKPGLDVIYTSPNLSKSVTETVMPVKNVDKKNMQKLNSFLGTLPNTASQPVNFGNSSLERCADTSVVVLCPGSSYVQSNISSPGETHSMQASRCSTSNIIGKSVSVTSILQSPFQTLSSAAGQQQLKVPVSTLPPVPSVRFPVTVLTVSARHQPLQIPAVSVAALSNLHQGQLTTAGLHQGQLTTAGLHQGQLTTASLQKTEVAVKADADSLCPFVKPTDVKSKDVASYMQIVATSALKKKPVLSSLLPSVSSPEASMSDLPSKIMESLPLSKAVAAAAMVSLSTLSTSSGTSENWPRTHCQSYSPSSPHISSQSTSRQALPHFLITSGDRTNLVISPAGIEHLQSLLRKRGISEGYFIITSPRVPTLPLNAKAAGEVIARSSGAASTETSKDVNLHSMEKTQNPPSVSSNNSSSASVPASDFEKMFDTKTVDNNPRSSEEDVVACGSTSKEDNLDPEQDESDSSSSSESRSSSAALVIETGDDDEKMEVGRSCSVSPSHNGDNDDIMEGEEAEDEPDSVKIDQSSVVVESPQKDTVWETESVRSDDARQCIPQSPLSLSDLIKQQQSRTGTSRHLEYSFLTSPENKIKESTKKNDSESSHLPTSESQDFQFPVPLCPASSYGASSQQHQHSGGGNIQISFQHVFPSTSSFSTDITFESSVQHQALESRLNQHLEDVVVTSVSPKLLSDTPSPKSPLSVQSSQALDQNTPLNPPMTPNTMLINLLNRVPTPFLTNPQDILSAPTSQESAVHETDTAADFPMVSNKVSSGIFSGKNLDFSSSQTHTQLGGAEVGGEGLLYSESSRSLASNAGSFAAGQNTLELIASNYASSSSRNNALSHDIGNTQLSSNFSMIGSKSYDSSYNHCGIRGGPQSLNFSENFQQESDCRDVCHSFQCKSCSQPLLVTVNLDPESPKYAVTLPSRGDDRASEGLIGNYGHTNVFDQTLNLTEHTCNGDRSGEMSRMAPEKSRETDILRHLILNTSSSSLSTPLPVQSLCGQQYGSSASAFNLSQSHHPQDSQFERRVESFLEPENQHKNLPTAALNPGGTCTFRSQDESFLHITHVHTSPSYDSSNTSFQASSHQSYESTVSSSFNDGNNSALGNQPNTSYIMEAEMASDTSYTVEDMAKSSISLSHDFIESGGRIQHLAPFRSDSHQNELFYQHPDQPGPIHQHHYGPSSQHQGLEFHIPPSHQSHQYPTSSLSHHDPSRMFSEHAGNVEYMSSEYQPQYYDDGGVAPGLPLYPQQCIVGSEAPVVGSTAGHPCNIPFSSAPTELQLEFRFPQEEEEDGNNIEKQPVLPSASFSPPSVADQAATPDPGGMSMYHGSFPNLSMYDMYVRGGSSDARALSADAVQELGSFCVECNIMYKGQCKFHPYDYVHISDTPILSHARLTLPACLRLSTSAIAGHNNNTGVFTKDRIPARTKFGPLIGSPVSCDKLSSTMSFSIWQTFVGSSVKVMDTNDENSSNWLMFVKPARVSMEQNLIAFQHGSSIYFVTRTDVEPGQELLFWFAKDYARMLGITAKPKNASHQLCPHCPVCKQVFPDRKQVQSHVRLQHPKPCTKKCSHCSRRFSQVSHLNAHIASVHLHVKKFVCPHCGKRFSDSSNFRKHVKSHSDERLFKCVICGKDFRQKAHLKLHMNTHMPVKNEECGFCGKRFTRAFTRRQHELQHTRQNKIPCAHCDKVFYKQQVYRQHLKIHRNERKYGCPHCNKAFRTKANLTRHGPACKQQKCVVIATHPAPPLSAPQIQGGDFLHSGHSDVSISGYSNDKSTSADNV